MTTKGEYTFKQVGKPLFEETVGDVTVRLIAEVDMAASVPVETLRYRSGRVFKRNSDGLELLNNGITFTAGNVDAFLVTYPKILKIVGDLKNKLPVKEKKALAAPPKDEGDDADALAKALGLEMPTPAYAAGKKKRSF